MEMNKIYCENCLDTMARMPDNFIDCCISSPPYWGLRDYGVDGQLGIEEKFTDFIIGLIQIYTEVKRILKPEGTCFINLGDSYASESKGSGGTHYPDGTPYKQTTNKGSRYGIKHFDSIFMTKCLLMIPERFAIQMIDLGWILRNQIIWHKPNQMPASAKDRFTVDFEKIFFFVKNANGYYFEQQLEPYTKPLDRWGGDKLVANGESIWDNGTGQTTYRNRNMRPNLEGKNMRTVWSINTESNEVAHFATYPESLVVRMVKAGCPEGGIVYDPFTGSGTTLKMAHLLKRNWIGSEISQEYVDLANKRLDQYLRQQKLF